MWQGQLDLVPIQRPLFCLKRVSFKIHRLQIHLVTQLLFNLLEAAELAVAGPELLQLGQLLETTQMLNRVTADIDDPEICVVIKPIDGCQEVMRDMELLQVVETGQPGNGGETVGLNRKDFEIRECVKAFYLCNLVLTEPKLF